MQGRGQRFSIARRRIVSVRAKAFAMAIDPPGGRSRLGPRDRFCRRAASLPSAVDRHCENDGGLRGTITQNLIGSYFGRGNGKRSGEQIPGEFKTHPANTSQPFVRASITPRSSCSPSEWSLRSRAASAFFTTFQ